MGGIAASESVVVCLDIRGDMAVADGRNGGMTKSCLGGGGAAVAVAGDGCCV